MDIITTVSDQQKYCKSIISDDKGISLIPTMGNLHKGHESLFIRSTESDNKRIASIDEFIITLIMLLVVSC